MTTLSETFEDQLRCSFRRIWGVAFGIALVSAIPIALLKDRAPWAIAVPILAGILLGIFLEFRRTRVAAEQTVSFPAVREGAKMKGRDSLKDLYLAEMKDLYDAENQLLNALPKMGKKASAPELKKAFRDHLEQTERHVERLDTVFRALGEKPTGTTCRAMKDLVEEGNEIIREEGDASVLDAALIGAAQRVEHYKMAGYAVVRTFASLLGENTAAESLQRTLNEEAEANNKLTRLVKSIISVEVREARKRDGTMPRPITEGGRQQSD